MNRQKNLNIQNPNLYSRMSHLSFIVKMIPIIVLIISIILSLMVWKIFEKNIEQKAQITFSTITENIVHNIIGRMKEHEQVLLDGAGLFNSKQNVSRTDWRIYISTLKLEQNHPGITGVGFTQWLKPSEISENIKKIRAEGFPDYYIRPEGKRDHYTSIIYLEPFNWRNQRAFGYDMYSEPVRKKAMDYSVNQRITSIAAKIILVQETEKDKQNGMLMYVPVFQQNVSKDTPAQRWKALKGFVYSPIRMNDFIYGTIGTIPKDIAFEIYTDIIQDNNSFMFSSLDAENIKLSKEFNPVFKSVKTIQEYGINWTFSFKTLPSFNKYLDKDKSYLILTICCIISVLLSLIIFLLMNTRNKALVLAEKMTQKVRENEDRIRLIFNSTAEAIYGIDLEGRCTFCNQACLNILGYSYQEELLGKDMHNQIHHSHPNGEPFDVIDCQIYQAFHKGQNSHEDNEVLWRKDHTSFPAEYWSYPQFQDGKITGAVVTFIDITERKKAEKELIESEQKLKEAQNISRIGSWEYDFINNKTTWSEGIYNLFELPSNGTVPSFELLMDFVFPEDRNVVKETYEKSMKNKTPFEISHRLQMKDGKIKWVNEICKMEIDKDHHVLKSIGIIQDITESKKAEEKLNSLSTRLQLATKAGGVGIWEYDIISGLFTWDEQMYMLYGINETQFSRSYKAWESMLHSEDVIRCNEEIKKAIENIQDFNTEFRVVWPDGTIHNIKALSIVQRDINGKALRMIGTNWDITRQKQEQFELLQANTAKSEFLANMSHEIRTPLNAVIGFTDLLQKTDLNEIQLKYVNNANIAAQSLLDIINDILDLSKIEAGKLDLELIKTNIMDIIDQVIDIIKYLASKKNIEVFINIHPDVPRIATVDPLRLKQILVNLLNNAVKFTLEGEVVLEVTFNRKSINTGEFSFYVKDTGIGINEEQKTKLFKAFSQGDGSTNRKFGGTGLGLIISNLLAEKMGSKIHFESKVGKGSIFFFHLTTEFEPIATLEKFYQIKKVLIIENHSQQRQILEKTLNSWDIQTISCDKGSTSIDILKNQKLDLIIIDYNLPLLNGFETIKLLEENTNFDPKKTPMIILINSSDHFKIFDQSKNLGILYHLIKPIKNKELYQLLKTIDSSQKSDHKISKDSIISDNSLKFQRQPIILIAEDVDLNMLLVKTFILQLIPNAILLEASNGKETIRLYETKKPDIILMDIQMPVLDGLATTKIIRELEEINGGHIPIIALTAGAFKGDNKNCLDAGMDNYLSKPIQQEKLKNILEQYLDSLKDNSILANAHFDKQQIINKFGDNPDFMEKLFKAVPEQLLKNFSSLQKAAIENDLPQIKIILHAIKGISLNLSFDKLTQIIQEAEFNVDHMNPEEFEMVYQKIIREWEEIQKIFH